MRHRIEIAFAAAITPLLLASANAPHAGGEHDWPQWRGPRLDGVSTETRWTASGKEASLWTSEVGLGYSSVSIQNGLLYTIGHMVEDEADIIWCLDANTGEEVWSFMFPSAIWNQYHTGGSLSTPSLAGDALYALNREGKFHCLDAATGDLVWDRDYAEELGVVPPTWGFSASPLLVGDQVIVNVGPILSIDPESGDVLWSSKDYGHAYATPAPFERDGKPLLAIINSEGLAVLDRTNGEERHHTEWKTDYDVNASTPIILDEGILVSSGYEHGAALFAFTDGGLEKVWETRGLQTEMTGPILIDGHIYGFDDAILKCFDLQGEEKWRARGLGKGALMAAPGRLLVMSARGELVVAEASPAGYSELSKQRVIDDGGQFWTRPVLAGGLVYCRSSLGTLVCRDHRAED